MKENIIMAAILCVALFFPLPISCPAQEMGVGDDAILMSEVFFQSEGETVEGILLYPTSYREEGNPGVIILHGLGWTREIFYGESEETDLFHLRYNLADELCKRGFFTLIYDQRGHGGSKSDMDLVLMIKDAINAITYLQGLPEIDPDRIGIIGHSMGSYIATIVAGMDERVKATALWAAPATLDVRSLFAPLGELFPLFMAIANILLPLVDEIARIMATTIGTDVGISLEEGRVDLVGMALSERGLMIKHQWLYTSLYSILNFFDQCQEYNAANYVSEIQPNPVLIVQGTGDALVAPGNANLLYEAAGEPKELVMVEGTGHRFTEPLDKREEVIQYTSDWIFRELSV